MVNGQSNARPEFFNAVNDCLTAEGVPFASSHFWAGGNQLRNWIDENGVKGVHWQPMMDEYLSALSACKDTGYEVTKIHMVYFQGESDVANSDTQDALNNGTQSIFVDKLTAFIDTFSSEINAACGLTPYVSIGKVGFDESHPTFIITDNLTTASVDLIRSEMDLVAANYPNVATFETADLGRRDHVHLDYWPAEGTAMKVAAQRALDLF